jgi:hypothetical protein
VADWSFLTSHARVLLCIAHDPGVRLRDSAARTGGTERTAYGIVTDLTQAGHVVKHEDGRRNRCQIQARLRLPETDSRERAIGEILALGRVNPNWPHSSPLMWLHIQWRRGRSSPLIWPRP